MNAKLKEMLERHEGRRSEIYKDIKGIQTIGVGHNLVANPLPTEMRTYLIANGQITDAIIDDLLEDDVVIAEKGCEKLYPDFYKMSENRMNGLTDFIFNVGYGTAKTFRKANACINSNDWDGAADNMMDSQWAVQVKGRAREVCDLIRNG
jgi:lysozyme